jgi:hypothetical protein
MSVLLRRSNALPTPPAYQFWLAVTGTPPLDDPDRKLPGLAKRLEGAFVAGRETWWELGRALSAEPGGDIAHMSTAGAFGSDFGIMLAWTRLVGELAGNDGVTLVVCNDPWLFRHLASLDGVEAGAPPSLAPETLRRRLRGFLARARVALRNWIATRKLSSGRRVMKDGDSVILVYGHPASDSGGNDAYFGDLMARHGALKRLLHTDCPSGQALELGADGRTVSLHAWGNPLVALSLVFCRWRPGVRHLDGEFGWLIRRAETIENSGGGPAMNRWQAHCQERWLDAARPDRVVWPWENHGWERNLCRAAHARNITTIGYQHTVIGPHHFNYATHTNHDGLASIPDVVVADGPAYLDEMQAWGVPLGRLVIGGAFRFPRFGDDLYDPDGPVFVPLSAIPQAARAQLDVARTVAGKGRRIVVKPHPMYPLAFDEGENLVRAERPLAEQRGLSAVLYATGTSGLETVLMGIPGYRLMLEDRISIDVLPRGFTTEAVTVGDAAEAILQGRSSRSPAAWDDILSDVDRTLWKSLLFGDIDAVIETPKDSRQT